MGFRQLSGRRWARQPLQAPPPRPRQRLHRSPRKLLRHQPRSGRPDRGRESTISKSALRGRWMRPGAAATALGGHRDPAGPRRAQSAALGSRHLLSFGTGAPDASKAACLMLAWPGGSASLGLCPRERAVRHAERRQRQPHPDGANAERRWHPASPAGPAQTPCVLSAVCRGEAWRRWQAQPSQEGASLPALAPACPPRARARSAAVLAFGGVGRRMRLLPAFVDP